MNFRPIKKYTLVDQKGVLHIDDDADDRFFVSNALEQISNSLVLKEAQNGMEGISYLEACKTLNILPCLVLLDMNMPLMNGMETAKKIKKDPLLSGIPLVLFTTTHALPDGDVATFISYGVRMVPKPAGYHEFLDCLNVLLKDFQLSDHLKY